MADNAQTNCTPAEIELGSRTMYTKPDSDSTYSSFALFGQTILENETETALKCLDEILSQRDAKETITLVDYGTSDGGNVVRFMNKMIDHIQGVKGTDQEINIIFEDQCFNDFNALFQTVKGLKGLTAIKESDTVHALVSGNSMYNKCLPHHSVDYGVSTLAVHWLSHWPLKLKAGISCYDADEEEMKMICQQAAKDWKAFVINRGKEMKSGDFNIGAYFFVESPTDSEKKGLVFKELSVVVIDMLKDDIITMEEFYNMNVPIHCTRSLEDLLDVFSNPEVLNLGLEVLSYKIYDLVVLEPIPEALVNDSTVAEHVGKLRMYIEIWFSNVIIHGLSKNRDQQQKMEIKEEVFERCQKRLERSKWTQGLKFGYGNVLFHKKRL